MKILILVLMIVFSNFAFSQEVPSATWSGRLILPTAEQRQADGGIFVEIENSPVINLKGHRVWLKYDLQTNTQIARRFRNSSRNVTFNKTAAENKTNRLLPERINGWKNVSPLESFVAAHNLDDIRVEILNPEMRQTAAGTALVISEEPVVIDGNSTALVKFIRSISKEEYEVRHYNRQTKDFSGSTEVIQLDFKKEIEGKYAESQGLDGIENHRANVNGWNIYGQRKFGKFILESLEPYDLTRLNTFTQTYSAQNPGALLENYWNINQSLKTQVRNFALISPNSQINIGDKFLVVHSFGAFDGSGNFFGFYRGHASLGSAEIRQHPITGEVVTQLMYYQVFDQSGRGLFAAKYRWHAYAGNLYRGRMFYRPITDALIKLPESFRAPIALNGESTNVFKELTGSLEDLMRSYRTGFGHGVAQITAVTSCVHDSGNVFIRTMEQGEKVFIQQNQKQHSSELRTLINHLGPAVDPPESFRNADLLPAGVDTSPTTINIVKKNMTITVPRNFQDENITAFSKLNSPLIYVQQTIQTGSDMPQSVPRAPSYITFSKIMAAFLKKKLTGN